MDMNVVRSLADMERQQTGRVRSMGTVDPAKLYQLFGVGILPGEGISMLQKDGRHLLVFACNREVALDRQTASSIMVDLVC